jgi:two-component SAPR family response regulator
MQSISCIIVDDDAFARRRLEGLLKKIPGVTLLASAGNAAKAIDFIIEKKPDVVFLEIEMKGRNGFEVVKDVRSKMPEVEFVVVTTQKHYAIRAVNAGVNGYLVKPVDLEELKAIIQKMLLVYNQ